MRKLICADSAGFCAGVARSVEMAERALAEHGRVWCLGELIHNRDEVERLKSMGLRIAASVEEVPEGEVVIIRSHGVGRATYEQLRSRRAKIIDATCVKVSRIHRMAEEAGGKGTLFVVIGDPKHPEVQGICG